MVIACVGVNCRTAHSIGKGKKKRPHRMSEAEKASNGLLLFENLLTVTAVEEDTQCITYIR